MRFRRSKARGLSENKAADKRGIAMINLWKQKLDHHEKTVGTFFESGSGVIMECMGLTGLDYAIIDTEHGPFEAESVGDFICAAEKRNLTPLVRVKDISRPAIMKMLDVGAKGLIIPQIHGMDEIHRVIEYGKYYPLGSRGVAGQRANGFAYDMGGSLETWFAVSNSETLLIPQCETMECLANISEVAGTDGIAGIFIGPYDLSTAMGIPGQFENPKLMNAVETIIEAAHRAGKFVMIYCDDVNKAKQYFSMGIDSVTVGLDVGILIEAYKNKVVKIRES